MAVAGRGLRLVFVMRLFLRRQRRAFPLDESTVVSSGWVCPVFGNLVAMGKAIRLRQVAGSNLTARVTQQTAGLVLALSFHVQ